MGAVTGLVGLGGGASGSGFSGPSTANLMQTVSPDQLSQAASGTNASMEAQKQLLAALQAQNGLGNQANVYNQFQDIVSGQGPNPAQAQLAQATGANIANQAALMAGQRGASANAGLIARQAAQQGAAAQQQAIGQAATLQANQSLNALNSAGNIANTQVSNQIGQTNANTAAQQANQQALLNAASALNNAQVGMQSNINNVNGQLANTTMQGQQGLIGGVLNGAGAALAGARGGRVKKMADGGDVAAPLAAQPAAGPKSSFGKFLKGMGGTSAPASTSPEATPSFQTGAKAMESGASSLTSALLKKKGAPENAGQGPTVANAAALPDASIPYNTPMTMARGGDTHDYRSGGHVKAKSAKEKAVKPGNSYANDKIPAVLSEHEIVIPRSVTMSKDPVGGAAKFVAAVIAKKKAKGNK